MHADKFAHALTDLYVRYVRSKPNHQWDRTCAKLILATRNKTHAMRDVLIALDMQKYLNHADDVLKVFDMYEDGATEFLKKDLRFGTCEVKRFMTLVWHDRLI